MSAQMTVAAIMTKEVVVVDMDDSIDTVRTLLKAARFHHLLVVDGRRLVGVLSDRDLLREISPFLDTVSERDSDRGVLNKKVHRIMTRGLITATETTTIETAAALLLDNNISCLPVISSEGDILGIVSWKDILRHCMAAGRASQDKPEAGLDDVQLAGRA